jgi:hypothetical protein
MLLLPRHIRLVICHRCFMNEQGRSLSSIHKVITRLCIAREDQAPAFGMFQDEPVTSRSVAHVDGLDALETKRGTQTLCELHGPGTQKGYLEGQGSGGMEADLVGSIHGSSPKTAQ